MSASSMALVLGTFSFSSDKDELEGLVSWVQKSEEFGTQLSDIGILVNTRASVDRVKDAR